MSKLFKVFLLFVLVTFISCETSEDEEPNSKLLVGTWNLIGITSEDGRIGSAVATTPNYFEILFYGEGEELDVQLTFSENPNSLEFSGDGFLYIRYITEVTDNIELASDIIGEPWDFAYDFLVPGYGWKVEGSKYLYDDVKVSLQVDYFAEILILDETTLKLKMRYNEDFPKTGSPWGRETGYFYATFMKI